MRKKIIYILVLVATIVILLTLKIMNRSSDEVKVIQISPIEGSQILASEERFEMDIYFENRIDKIINKLIIEDNFGLVWQKDLKDINVLSVSTEFDKEIMSIEELEVKLLLREEVLGQWLFEVPLDEKAMGKIVEAKVEENASFIPESEDIDFFSKQDEIANQEQPLWQELPFETNKFKISHYIEPMKLVVYIKSGEKKDIEIEVNKWIKSKGGSVSKHEIEWR